MSIFPPRHGRNISTIIRLIQHYPSIIDYIETKDFVEEEGRPPCTGHTDFFTVIKKTQRKYVTTCFYKLDGTMVYVEFKDGVKYVPVIEFVPSKHPDPLIAQWVLENYELPIDIWGFSIFTGNPGELGEVLISFEELTQF